MELFRHISFGFAPFFVLKAALETGMLREILDKKLSPKEIARRLGLSEDGTKRVLAALELMGAVFEENGRFQVTERYRGLFDSTSPFYIKPYLEHMELLESRWKELSLVLRGERSEIKKRDLATLARALFAANHEDARKLKNLIGRASKVLDVGCGSCVWSLPFAREGAEAVGIDFPEVIEKAARTCLSSAGVLERYRFVEGDFFEVDWGTGFDLVIFGHICHIFPAERLEVIFEKARSALRPSGKLAIVDFFKDEKRLFPALFEINMFLATSRGKVYSSSELTEIAEKHGFSKRTVAVFDRERCVKALIFEKA